MGLSGRRRARKENRGTQTASSPYSDAVDSSGHCHSALKRTGNTCRRVFPKAAREMTRTNLLAFDARRGFQNDLQPPREPMNSEPGMMPNRNVHYLKMIRILGHDYNDSLAYSLNKRRRWTFMKEIKSAYESCEELKAQNIFLKEAVAKGRRDGGSVTKLTTNAYFMLDAAKELRAHEKKLKAKYACQPKPLVNMNDRFKFSEQVNQERTERPLRTIASANGGPVNAKSIERACNLWNNLYNVSPNAEQVREGLQRDYDGRMEVFIGTCIPSPTTDVKRCRQVEKSNSQDRNECASTKKFPYHDKKRIESAAKKISRSVFEVQLEMDGHVEVLPDVAADDKDSELVDDDNVTASRPSRVTIFDAMRLKVDISANRVKKMAMKQRKKKLDSKMTKLRKDSGQTAESSGYHSECETPEMDDVQMKVEETQTKNVRLSEALDAALTVDRPKVRLPLEASNDSQIKNIFPCGCDAAPMLVLGKSHPKKLAVLLRPDLSENVVFEEIELLDPGFKTFKVLYTCTGDKRPRTSALEIASQIDPFAFLHNLTAESDAAAKKDLVVGQAKEGDCGTVGWKRANVLTEEDARLRAIRALPMFSTKAADADSDLRPEVSADCEICYRQLPLGNSYERTVSFVEGSTTLSECGHRFCNQCWLQHVASSIAQGRAGVTCPGYKCQSILDAATLLWFCPSDLLSALTAAAFRAWLTDRRSARQTRFCPQTNCSRLLECSRGVNAVCDRCSGSLCLGCGMEPHWPADCATAAGYLKKMKELGHVHLGNRNLDAETDVNAKQCPACRLVMEKGYGCNHMSCPCGEHFCWWCGQSMRTHRSGPCATESSARARSEYRVQRVFNAKDSFLTPSSDQSRMYCSAVKIRWLRESNALRSRSMRKKIVGLFLSYTIRFHQEPSTRTYHEATREAQRVAERMIEGITQATYLLENSYAHLDRHPGDRRVNIAVRTIGRHMDYLMQAMSQEIQERCLAGFQGPKQTKRVYERLMMMERCLSGACRMLHSIVVQHRESVGGRRSPRRREAS